MPEKILTEQTEENALTEFVGLIKEVAALPKEQQEKVTCYTQGVIAATNRKKAENE